MKLVVFSLGCKVNQYEGRSMIKALEERGYEVTDSLERADYYIINTCSVTAEADKKSRQAVARVLKLNPEARVAICGCSSQNDPFPYKYKQNVTRVGGTSGKMQFVESIISDIVFGEPLFDPPDMIPVKPTEYEDDLFCELTKSRGYIKVQDGCNNFCSYCIVPHLRGRSRSRSLASIVAEAKYLEQRTREIVVTGINVSAYGLDISLSLIDLVCALGEISVRKRFGSLECTAITKPLLESMRDGGWCDSFHLSLQSGSDDVLKRMNRKYTAAEFNEKCDLIRSVFPDAGITTDVIVGFPGETDEDFNMTIETCRRARFSGIHVFPYSRRKGTAAAQMEQTDRKIKLARAATMREFAAELKREVLESKIGKTREVFFETAEDGYVSGFSSDYIRVYADEQVGTMSKIKLTEIFRDGIKGERI